MKNSPNLNPKTRPYNNQRKKKRKKKRTYWIVDLFVPVEHRVKSKEIKNWTLLIIIIIIIIIMPCCQHGYPRPSLSTSPYRSLPMAGLQGYISHPHRAAVCMFELVVLLLLGPMWGSIGVHHLWARPCFSSSVLHVWFI